MDGVDGRLSPAAVRARRDGLESARPEDRRLQDCFARFRLAFKKSSMSAINSWIVAEPPAISPAVTIMSVNWNTACWNDHPSAPPNSKMGPRSRTPDSDTRMPSVKPTRSARLWVPALYSLQRLLGLRLGVLFRRARLRLETGFPALAPCLDENFERAFDEQGNDVEYPQLRGERSETAPLLPSSRSASGNRPRRKRRRPAPGAATPARSVRCSFPYWRSPVPAAHQTAALNCSACRARRELSRPWVEEPTR